MPPLFLLCLAIPLLVMLPGCGRGAVSESRVVGILPFEYQGADLDSIWMARALTIAATEQARGAAGRVMLARDANEARRRQATQLLRGIVSGDAKQGAMTVYLEDLGSREVEVVYRGAISSPDDLLTGLRESIGAAGLGGIRYSTQDGEAFESYGRALMAGTSAEGEQLLKNALQRDPTFSAASMRLAALYAASDRAAAIAELERLRATLPDDRELEHGLVAFELANLRGDRNAMTEALEAVAAAVPQDLDMQRRLAQAYLQQRRFAEAASVFAGMAAAEPEDPEHWNQLVYAHAYAGNRAEALRAMDSYRRAAPQDPNVGDSLGDVHFFFAEFREAAQAYEAAHDVNPGAMGGFSMFKAAWAWVYAGELAKADDAAGRYIGELRQSNVQLADLRNAQWQYLRGRRVEARSAAEAMRRQQSNYSQAFLSLLASQLYFWDAAEKGPVALAFQNGAPYGLQVRPQVAAVAQAMQPRLTAAQRAELTGRLVPLAQQATIVAVATYLDCLGQGTVTPDALQALQVADASVPESRAMVTHQLLAWALTQSGQAEAALQLFARRLPPVPEDDGLLWPLVFPQTLRWEQEAARISGKPAGIAGLDALVNVLGR